MRSSIALVLTLFTAAVHAQQTTVDYDDATLVQPPQAAFPFYTPGAGQTNQTVRWQGFVPAAFPGMPQQAMFVSRVGFQLQGRATYSTFVGRAGAQKFTNLSTQWAQNLPDQRVQFDASGLELAGGARTNAWIEFPLAHPFVWTPGENVVVDLTTHIKTTGILLMTALGTNPIPRLVDFNYQGSPSANAAPQSTGGIKLRLVFTPLDRAIVVGQGCPGTGAVLPALVPIGAPKIGNALFRLTLTGARPNAPAALMLGQALLAFPEVRLGGTCRLWTATDACLFATTDANGYAVQWLPLNVPVSLAGVAVHAQWLVADPASASMTGLSFSNGATVPLY